MVSVLGTDPGPGFDAPRPALRHPGRRVPLPAGLGLSRTPVAPRALVTACSLTDRRSRRTRAGLQSGRSLNACTETATAEQPEAAVRDRSRNQPRSRERRRRASPHVSRADMLGITKPSRQRNPARYRIEAARARRAPTRNRRREARPVLARRRPRRGPKAEGRSLFQSDARATECRWTTRPLGVGHPARTPTAFSYVAMTTRSGAWARVRKAPRNLSTTLRQRRLGFTEQAVAS